MRTTSFLFLIVLVGISLPFQSFGQTVIEFSEEAYLSPNWEIYETLDGVTIEYKMTLCEGENVRSQNNVLFRFTNATDREQTISWTTKVFRNGVCWNCERLDNPEYAREITLAPYQIIEGENGARYRDNFYIFGNFTHLVPGMTNQRLTSFELVDLNLN